ncbi:ankyrin repeat domain-containing protein [Sneathiella sp.]|uniref:ankyrin repeat domain-containing protein n=1 Tax=Sneathiella sp. TaxID=1964365 RepID=UPI002FE0A7BD
MQISLLHRVNILRAAVIASLLSLGGCFTPIVTSSGSFGDFSRLDPQSQRQQVKTSENPDKLFEALVYGLVSDRTDLVAEALNSGADPNRGLSWELIRQTELIEYEKETRAPVTDKVWEDGGPLTAYSFLLGGWCNETEKTTGRCVLKGPWSVYDVPSTLFPVFALVRSPEAVDLMLRHGAKTDQELLDGTFHAAARFGEVALMQRLVEMGARPDAMGVDGMFPLHRAAQFGHAEAIAWLLDQGIDPNTGSAAVEPVAAPAGGRLYRGPGIGQAGVTPLHIVAANGVRDMKYDQKDLQPLIGGVVPGAPGAQAGLQAGDMIRAINGQPINSFKDFVDIVRASPGVPLSVRIERQGQLYDTRLTPSGPVGGAGRGASGAVGASSGAIAIGQQTIGKAWVTGELWRPDWRTYYTYNEGYRESLELLIAAGAYMDARANWRVMPSWWNATGNLAAFDQTPLHVAYDKASFDIVEGLIDNGADEDARLATGETPKQTSGKENLAVQTEVWRYEQEQRMAQVRQRQQDNASDNSFAKMIALGGAAAITAYGAGQGMGAESLTMGAGMAADILSDGKAGGIDTARDALQNHAATQRQMASPLTPVMPPASSPVSSASPPASSGPAATATTPLSLPGQVAGACENTLSIGSVQHSFLQLSLPSGSRIAVQASVHPAQGGRAVRLESVGSVGNASRVVAQILIPGNASAPANLTVMDDNTVPGLENGAVGTLDVYRGREYANFRSNFDYGRNRTMGSVQLLETGTQLRGTFSFEAVEDGYPRRGNQYRADIAGSFCVS